MKTALITGIAGQDGSYLADLLLEKGYKVVGLTKPRSDLSNIEHIKNKIYLKYGDITDSYFVNCAVFDTRPDEIYNLAAQSHVGESFKTPIVTTSVNYTGYLNVLLAARRYVPKARIYQAGTSEMFGYAATEGYQNEITPLMPKSPYAIAKVAAHWAGVNARYEANQFVSNGILFNHESPRRHESFVTKKITNAVNRIKKGSGEILRLGNIDSQRDWGHAQDYVLGMWLMLQHDKPDDFVLATGETHTVREFVFNAFKAAGLPIVFKGSGLSECGYIRDRLVMTIDPEFYRPNELAYIKGDASKAKSVLGWKPEISFNKLVYMMVNE